MCDDAPAYFNAWKRIMGSIECNLLCAWHVDRAWRKNLSKISKKHKMASVYKTLKMLQIEKHSVKFEELMTQFMTTLSNDEDTTKFHEYFTSYYANRCLIVGIFCYAGKKIKSIRTCILKRFITF